ncbi:DUF7144 family membrane protein [Salininema proteolyticum]|uniref:DUF7144 domain-containing protein n=1 Tax=Salininema proteolyticum TaxID=1607685 RepID=A0ABV8U4G3_9ACTN
MAPNNSTKTAWAVGGLVFAAVLMVLNGVFQALQGVVAIAGDEHFAAVGDYSFALDTTAWGWLHLVLGLLVAAVGLVLPTRSGFARSLAIALVVLQALAQFLFLPYEPWWTLVVIALDVFIIWAVANAPLVVED